MTDKRIHSPSTKFNTVSNLNNYKIFYTFMNFIVTIAKGYIITISTIIIILIASRANSQNIRAYSFGSIGNAGGLKTTYSGSIYFQSSACILITNGIKTFQESEDGSFTNYCEAISLKDEPIPLNANPNPISTYTYIKFKDIFLIQKEETVLLQLVNTHGSIVNEYKTNLSMLNYGYKIQLNDRLQNGVYFIKASTPTKLFKTLRIIKNK